MIQGKKTDRVITLCLSIQPSSVVLGTELGPQAKPALVPLSYTQAQPVSFYNTQNLLELLLKRLENVRLLKRESSFVFRI